MLDEIQTVQDNAELLYSAEEVEHALEKMAKEITLVFSDRNPIVLCMMIGGMITAGKLIPLLNFPLQIEYIHATRYHGTTQGEALQWIRKPTHSLHDRSVLLIDDILDHGITLAATIQACKNQQAKYIKTAILVDKQVAQERQLKHADFTGLMVPDRYIFGYGLDYKTYLRNAHGIYAIKKDL